MSWRDRHRDGRRDGDRLIAVEPIRRMGKPEEIGEAVVWLMSDYASFVTGASLPVDGAMTAQ